MARIEDDLLSYSSSYVGEEGVLINKLGLTNEEELNKAERIITTYKLAKLYLEPGPQTFDANHYISIHKYLFEDIYPFAGEIRNENIQKRIPFCLPNLIFPHLQSTLETAIKKISSIDSRDKLLLFITELYSDLDIIHPFREGNGRCEREFIRQLVNYICKKNGLEPYQLDYSKIENREAYIDAVVKADVYLDYSDLLLLFDSILEVNGLEEPKLEAKPS